MRKGAIMTTNTFDKLAAHNFSVGVELPLDNDWAYFDATKGTPFGVPDLTQHHSRIQLADKLGFKVAWVRDVPIYDPNFGDAAQVFETFTYLGYLAGITDNILLGTAAVVLPLRQPWLVKKAAASVQKLSGNRLILGVASGDRPVEQAVGILGEGVIATNQVEVHPYLTNDKVRAACDKHGIVVTGYMPFAVGKVLKDDTIVAIAEKHGVSAAEVVVAWELANGLVTIPSSTKRKNLETNFKALDLTLDAQDIAKIDALDCGDRQATPDFAPEWD